MIEPGDATRRSRRAKRVGYELAWAAGFYDGEGSVTAILRKPRPSHPNGERWIALSISQKDREVLDRFRSIVGYGIVNRRNRPACPYVYSVRARAEVRRVAEMLWPWLGTKKREQFERAFALYFDGWSGRTNRSRRD